MAYKRYNDNNYLQFSSNGNAVGVFMKPRDTDEGLCVPQSVDGPCFRTATPVDNNPQVRKELYNAISTKAAAGGNKAKWYNELLSIAGTANSFKDSLYEEIKYLIGNWMNVDKPNDYGEEMQTSYHYGAHKSVVYPRYYTSGYERLHPRSWNMGEFTYDGYVMPYNSTSGFVQHSWIPSNDNVLMLGDSVRSGEMFYHTYRKNYDNADMNVSHMLALGGMVFEDYCCPGYIATLGSPIAAPIFMLAAIPEKLSISDRITAWAEDPATGECMQSTYLMSATSSDEFTRDYSMPVNDVNYWVLGRCKYLNHETNPNRYAPLFKQATIHITKFHTQGDTCDGTTDLY